MRRSSLRAGALAVVLFGCAAALPRVTPQDAQRVGVALERLQAGRELYIAKCSGCHGLYPPQRYTDDEWAHWVEEMAPLARLRPVQKEQILLYLQAMNDGAHP
ncbi:MAG: hypothetical protein KatS3mg115_0570 [Candidatus Poribacteria bacterium]|nr:MAG: hypothetical protein KatS3mg115_0570 [Candidatus Poribacteria bacterium]